MNLFFNDKDIQLSLELKNSYRKYHPVFPKNSSWVYWSSVYRKENVQILRNSIILQGYIMISYDGNTLLHLLEGKRNEKFYVLVISLFII